MKSERSLRLYRERNHQKKQSNSPTLASSYSEKRLWAKNYKNQPFPRELKRRLIGHKFQFSDFSDQQEDNNGIVLEEEQNEVFQKKKKLLPHFKIISDRGQFIGNRSRIKSEQKFDATSQRCKSVESLKLPQVMEEKKEEDDLQKLARFKISDFKDHNQFNQRSNRNSENNSNHDNQALEPNIYTSTIPILQNEAEQTKSQKVKNDKSLLTAELEKIIVDQVDDKKKVQQQQIQQIIEQQKLEQQVVNLNPLRFTLDKIEQETELFEKFKQQQLKLSSHNSDISERSDDGKQKAKKKRHEPNQTINQ